MILLPKLILATHNPGKVAEMSALLKPYIGEILTARELNLPDVEETGTTLEENALLKARAAVKATGLPSLGEDTGLYFDCMDGEPGIYPKRWSQDNGGFPAVFDVVETKVRETSKEAAVFKALCTLVFPDGEVITTTGETVGKLMFPAVTGKDVKGFGYDPIFTPKGYDHQFAALPLEVKLRESHRGKAIQALRLALTSRAAS